MNIAVIGSGGREHSVCFKLKQSKEVNKIFCIPGNAGTSAIAENINIDILNFKSISDFLRNNNIKILWLKELKIT
jgi:phosphoribosylamine--glycine ligase